MVLNGTIGARLHIAFPILNRSSFGFWLSYFSVISRVVLSLFWFGIQTFVGSESVYQVQLLCLFPVCGHLMIVISDVKSHLAIHRSPPEPPSSKRTYNYLWCVSTTFPYQKNAHVSRRVDVLFSFLAHSVPVHVRLSTEDTLAIYSQINHSSAHMVSAAYLGTGQSAPEYWPSHAKGRVTW